MSATASATSTATTADVTGSASYATLDGYTYQVAWTVDTSAKPQSETLDQPPGQAAVLQAVSGSITVTNTTAGHEAPAAPVDLNFGAMYAASSFLCSDQMSGDTKAFVLKSSPTAYCVIPLLQFESGATISPSGSVTAQGAPLQEPLGSKPSSTNAEPVTGLPEAQTGSYLSALEEPTGYMMYIATNTDSSQEAPEAAPSVIECRNAALDSNNYWVQVLAPMLHCT